MKLWVEFAPKDGWGQFQRSEALTTALWERRMLSEEGISMEGREWADEALAALLQGRTVQIQPRGRSLSGRVNDGDLVTLEPCDLKQLAVGDIVLARVRERILVLHLILDMGSKGFLIGNLAGRADGWVSAEDVFGRVTIVQPAPEKPDV